jgi:hypothetical protein
MTTWRPPADRMLSFFDSLDEYVNSLPSEKQKQSHKMLRSYWPPNNVDELNLTWWYASETILNFTPLYLSCLVCEYILIIKTLVDSLLQFWRDYAIHHQRIKHPSKLSYPDATLSSHVCREGKRSAEATDDQIDTKKPKLMAKDIHSAVPSLRAGSSDPEAMDEGAVITEITKDGDEQRFEENQRQSTSSGRIGNKISDGGGGTFKEPPFTYLSSDDPTLLSCL